MDIQELAARLDRALEENRIVLEENRVLKERIGRLEKELEAAKREPKRQAAPHRKAPDQKKPPSEHKRAGRPVGHEGSYRKPPETIDREVRLPLQPCTCGCSLEDVREETHYVEDIPPIFKRTTRYVGHSGWCPACGLRVNQVHPDVISAAPGAAKTSIGVHGVSLMAQMRVLMGASFEKIARFFTENLGLKVSKGGVLNILQNLGEHLGPSAELLRDQLVQSLAVHGDETGWWLEGKPAWAWSFSNQQTCLYRIEHSRAHGVVLDVLGPDFAGFLISDFLGSYDPLPYKKGKCMSHLLRFLKELIESSDKEAACFARRVKRVIKVAMAIKRRLASFEPAELQGFQAMLDSDLDVLCGCKLEGRLGQRLSKRLQKHRKHILTFLHEDAVDATNNLAERDIRPFVIFRKLCGGTRSQLGAQALARLMSTYNTCRKRGIDFLRFIAAARQSLMGGPEQLALPP